MKTRGALWFLPALALAAVVIGLGSNTASKSDKDFHLDPITLPADGKTTFVLPVVGEGLSIRTIDRSRSVHIEHTGSRVIIRSGVIPGRATIELTGEGFRPSRFSVDVVADSTDSFEDGTPDSLRLQGPDQNAFRNWFTALAESVYFRPTDRLPREIDDCAALLRFAFREALRAHDGSWANGLALDIFPALAEVGKYRYPFTPLGANVFRIKDGKFDATDSGNGAFAQFADAETLRRFNTHFISRDLRAARPGDLLFYRQLEQQMPYHAMIFLGRSQFEPGAHEWIVYHTGPIGSSPGEVRRPSTEDLLNHREPRWRPNPANNNFLGIYRWNILR